MTTPIEIPVGGVRLPGDLTIPRGVSGLVLFVHGSGSSRLSRRNRQVAGTLQHAGMGTLLFDLLTREEEVADADGHIRFDIEFLSGRLRAVTHWVISETAPRPLELGYFGSSTGAAAALVAATDPGLPVRAIVSRGGRPDLAGDILASVRAPVLLIVGGDDADVLSLNRNALTALTCPKQLVVVPGATHLFEEPGKLEAVAALAADWFRRYLKVRSG